jgi:Uma2 family endonuclease
MMNAALKLPTKYTYGDYCNWSEDERWELIDGEAYAMSAPSRLHQKILVELARQIGNYLEEKTCEVYVAPFDVRLPKKNEKDEQIDTVVQPDISVICDENKLDNKGCRGAPDWVIEILSPSNSFRDLEVKKELYEKHGVKEYWIINPEESQLMVYLLDFQGKYSQPFIYSLEQPVQVSLFPDLKIDWEFLSPKQIK